MIDLIADGRSDLVEVVFASEVGLVLRTWLVLDEVLPAVAGALIWCESHRFEEE